MIEETLEAAPVATLTPEPSISDFKIECQAADHSEPLFSPSGNWVALLCIKNEIPGLIVVHKNETSHFIEFQPYTLKPDEKAGPGTGGGLLPAKWTPDEKYLYFTSNIEADGSDICFYGSNQIGLYRLTVDSGEISAVFPVNPKMPRMVIFDFSPGARYLAYIKHYPPDSPIILDMQNGKEISVPVRSQGVGDLHWSQNGRFLAFVACSQKSETDELPNYRVYKFSLEENRAIQLYEGLHEIVYLEGFDSNNRLIANHHTTIESGRLFFDLESNKMVVETPEK